MQDASTSPDPAAELRAILVDLLLLQLIDAGAALQAKASPPPVRKLGGAPAFKLPGQFERLMLSAADSP